MARRSRLKRVLKPIALVIGVIYFLIDLLVLAALRPLLKRLFRHRLFKEFARWIETLGPYQSLVVVLTPIVLLEPVKPVGAYLIALGHWFDGTALIALGELLKIVFIERLFALTKPKLMTITAFSISYNYALNWWNWLKDVSRWNAIQRGIAEVLAVAKQSLRQRRR